MTFIPLIENSLNIIMYVDKHLVQESSLLLTQTFPKNLHIESAEIACVVCYAYMLYYLCP